MSFAVTWMDLEIITLSEVSQRKKNITWYNLYVESKKNYTNELIYKTETDSQTQKMNSWLTEGKGGWEGQIGSLVDMYTLLYLK